MVANVARDVILLARDVGAARSAVLPDEIVGIEKVLGLLDGSIKLDPLWPWSCQESLKMELRCADLLVGGQRHTVTVDASRGNPFDDATNALGSRRKEVNDLLRGHMVAVIGRCRIGSAVVSRKKYIPARLPISHIHEPLVSPA